MVICPTLGWSTQRVACVVVQRAYRVLQPSRHKVAILFSRDAYNYVQTEDSLAADRFTRVVVYSTEAR